MTQPVTHGDTIHCTAQPNPQGGDPIHRTKEGLIVFLMHATPGREYQGVVVEVKSTYAVAEPLTRYHPMHQETSPDA